jgi:hypothetical protein
MEGQDISSGLNCIAPYLSNILNLMIKIFLKTVLTESVYGNIITL